MRECYPFVGLALENSQVAIFNSNFYLKNVSGLKLYAAAYSVSKAALNYLIYIKNLE